MTNISTKLIYIDYKDLIANYKNPEFWGKKWTIYDYANIKVELAINCIACSKNEIIMGLNVYYKGNKKKCYKCEAKTYIGNYNDTYYLGTFAIPIDHPEYTNDIFKNKVYGKVQDIISSIEKSLICEFPNYVAETDRLDELEDTWEKLAGNWLDDKGVEGDDIRQAYIDAYIDSCRHKTADYRDDIVKTNTNKVLAKELLLFASFNNKEDDVKKYSDILKNKKVSKSKIRTWLQNQKDEEIQWEDLLGEIK